ncbi:MAG: EFR1 family ferrodoxin [Lawsonibacter sp.]|nr:EFR1 family ferrodoxin [Lawsonibacter sp.]MCI6399371.1 EFR1 family ferrodoxin [Lawsonibacter sp.]
MIVYFTGTGNSRYCAQQLADQLEDTLLDAVPFIRDGIAAELFSEKPWVFAAPTYGWQLPRVFARLIQNGSFAGSRDAYFVMTCGSEIGNAARYNQALCRKKGLRHRGTLPVVMPENYIALFDAPEEAEARKIIAAAQPALERGIGCIRSGRDFPAVKAGLTDKLKSGIVNAAFYRFIVRAKPFTVSDACIRCGKCENACPLGNLRLRDGTPVWGGRCTHCMACICGCPARAIEYGTASRGKPRYQCPEYEK